MSPLFLNELASCQFIRQRQNIVMVGNPGRGKMHLSVALPPKACSRDSMYLIKNSARLSTELCKARDNYLLRKLEQTFTNANLRIGVRKVVRLWRPICCFHNYRVIEWSGLFENNTVVTTLIDWLTFRSHVLDMNRESYRSKIPLQGREKAVV